MVFSNSKLWFVTSSDTFLYKKFHKIFFFEFHIMMTKWFVVPDAQKKDRKLVGRGVADSEYATLTKDFFLILKMKIW